MEWHSYLDIFMLQVYTINLCIILKVCQPMGFKVLLDISLRQLRILNQAMLRYVGIWGKRPLEMLCILLINKIDLPPEELIPQFDYVKDISEQFGFVNIGVANYEADDVIGTLAKIYSKDNEVHIVTGDRDILQCINEQVEVWLIRKGFNIYHHYTLNRFNEEYALHPLQLIDIKAFMGDSADGYPGVKGIGENRH